MFARADTSPALKGRGSVVTPAKGRVYRTASWKVGPACVPCPHPGLPGRKFGQDWLHKVFFMAGGRQLPAGQSGTSCPVLYLFKAPLKSAREKFPGQHFFNKT